MSLKDAFKGFGVPKSTLWRWSNGRLSPIASQAIIIYIIWKTLDMGEIKKCFLDLVNLYFEKINPGKVFKMGVHIQITISNLWKDIPIN